MRLRRPSPSMLVASTALVVALGGTGYAAVTLPKNSVGTNQIRPGAVRAADIAPNAVSGAKVADGSLRAADFATGELPAGATGATGATGPQGARGPSDVFVAGTENNISLPDSTPSTPQASLTLGAGSYLISVNGAVFQAGTGRALSRCILNAGGTPLEQQADVTSGGSAPGAGVISMSVVRTYSGGGNVVSVSCNDHIASTTGDASMNGPLLTALQVATVTGP